jgi:hypothetical protein
MDPRIQKQVANPKVIRLIQNLVMTGYNQVCGLFGMGGWSIPIFFCGTYLTG